jgi:hypothetical protein
VVFLDEASLPDEKKMVLKVLHPYLDECRVAFVAVANKSFDAANANRMICIYRSLPSKDDQKILAYGCLGLPISDEQSDVNKQLDHIISGLCQGYRRVLTTPIIPRIFHDRDFIYMLRELRFELSSSVDDQETSINSIKPISLLRALEDNFNGIKQNEFGELVNIFFESVEKESPNFSLTTERRQAQLYRDVPTILRESMKLDSKRRRLYGRYKLIIDESEDESAINLLSQTGILNFDPNQTTVFRMSDFSDDINNELRNVEILSTIKLCMETGKTILMVNTSRIHGSLYDVFNQNFSIMATGETRKIFSKVAIGPKTIDVVVHEDFQCIIHIKRSELKDTPAPFLSRFQKYSLSVNDFYRIRAQKLPRKEQIILSNIEEKAQTFIQHFGRQYFYGLNESTLYSCLLPLIKINDNGEHSLLNIYQSYTQLTMKLKSFIEQNSADIQQCLLRFVLSKLIQLVSPESIILKLPTFETTVGQWLCNLYFQQQEHFNIENFIQQLLSNPLINVASDDSEQQMILDTIHITTKAVIFTRTSSYVVSLSQQSKNELFSNNDENYDHNREKIDILNLVSSPYYEPKVNRTDLFLRAQLKILLNYKIDSINMKMITIKVFSLLSSMVESDNNVYISLLFDNLLIKLNTLAIRTIKPNGNISLCLYIHQHKIYIINHVFHQFSYMIGTFISLIHVHQVVHFIFKKCYEFYHHHHHHHLMILTMFYAI